MGFKGLEDLVRKRIAHVVIKEARWRSPRSQVFLVFDDNTAYEFYCCYAWMAGTWTDELRMIAHHDPVVEEEDLNGSGSSGKKDAPSTARLRRRIVDERAETRTTGDYADAGALVGKRIRYYVPSEPEGTSFRRFTLVFTDGTAWELSSQENWISCSWMHGERGLRDVLEYMSEQRIVQQHPPSDEQVSQ